MIKKVMFYSLLLPYLLLGVIGGLYIMVMYRTSVDNNRESIMDSNRSIIAQIDKDMQYIFEDADQLLSEINNINSVMQLREMGTERTGSDNFHIAMALNQLKRVSRFNTYIEDVVIYFHQPKLYLTARSIRTPAILLEEYQMEGKVDAAAWESFLTAVYDKKQIASIGTELFLTVTNSYGEGEGTANLFIKFNTDKLKGMMDGYHSINEGEFYVSNSDGACVIHHGGTSGEHIFDTSGHIEENQALQRDRSQYVVISRDGASMGIKYLWFAERIVIDKKSDFILQSFFLVGVMFSMLLLAGIWSVRLNYQKINQILERLKLHSVKDRQKKRTEVGFINEALNTMEMQLGARDGILLEAALKKGINGWLEEGDEEWRFLLSKTPFLFSRQTMLAVWGNRFRDEKEIKERKLDIFILDNIVNELLGDRLWIGILAFSEWNLVLMNGELKEDASVSRLMEQLEIGRRFLTDYYSTSYTVGVSTPSDCITELKTAYEEALAAFEAGRMADNQTVIYYGSMSRLCSTYQFNHSMRKKLLNCMKAGAVHDVGRLIEKIYEENFAEKMLSAEGGKMLTLEVINTCLEAAEGLDLIIRPQTEAILEDQSYPDVMFERIKAVVLYIAEYADSGRADMQVHVAEIIAFIQQNFQDIQMNVPCF